MSGSGRLIHSPAIKAGLSEAVQNGPIGFGIHLLLSKQSDEDDNHCLEGS